MSSGDNLSLDVSGSSGQPRDLWVHRVDGHRITETLTRSLIDNPKAA